jgi:hypothetical protein
MSGEQILINIVALALGTLWLCGYIFGLYSLGRRAARAPLLRARPKMAFGIFMFGASLLTSTLLLFDLDLIYLAALMVCVWLLHAQPVSVGFWAGLEIARKEDEEAWERNVDVWLREWEDRIPEWTPDDLDGHWRLD